MSEPVQNSHETNLPHSELKPRSRISIIWLVPFVALLIGAWIAYQVWSEMGATITITFKTAEGLDAGKTKIKYKNVEIGQVTNIQLNHKTKDVIVTAEMKKEVRALLTDQTRFWVVRARIDVSGASGLETLLSGAYIGVDPNPQGKPIGHFKGLETPPVVTGSTPGKHFILHSQNLGSIERSVPIYYRKFNVGQVEEVKLDDDGQSVTIGIFIRAPFDRWVNATTRFWNASGIDFSMTAAGIKLDSESLVSMLIGGIAFESQVEEGDTLTAENNSHFKLFSNREESLRKESKSGFKFVVNFSESVRGLTVGAPVEFKGMQLGEVTDIQLSYDMNRKKISVPVTIELDYSRVKLKRNIKTRKQLHASHKERINYFIQQGMRAQLQTGNIITGQLFIDLGSFPNAPPYTIDWDAKTPEFPAIPGILGVIKHDISSILTKVDAMMTQIHDLSYKLNHNVVPGFSRTLEQAERSLVAIESTLKSDSPLQQDLQITLKELAKAARSIKNLTDYLERHPESLINGKKEIYSD